MEEVRATLIAASLAQQQEQSVVCGPVAASPTSHHRLTLLRHSGESRGRYPISTTQGTVAQLVQALSSQNMSGSYVLLTYGKLVKLAWARVIPRGQSWDWGACGDWLGGDDMI